MTKAKIAATLFISSVLWLGSGFAQAGHPAIEASTPAELVTTYGALADTLLGAKQAESGLVLSILAVTYRHAEGVAYGAIAKIGAGEDARADLEKLAALVSQLGNEGDAAVAAVRKRLLEGGHHHNAAGEAQGVYDEGFVVVTRAARKSFLQSATEIGKMAGSPNAAGLKAAWEKVSSQYQALVKAHGESH